ncbi:N-acyl homoserine lactonase family protein [Defluviimonas sp. D31]|uniref:N-acyl homoserine lactonase family protein n=1 Tax=Defluviimonas sp. D31 TaxID=3083253 RepID=UPI00296EA286|nr:N-acyl homoserine lactonase family protein [Defluviimonas sp. D31]MDW4549835.1 N-acyl homoserine lactonase family protein [Defluviimonas sp. D31]
MRHLPLALVAALALTGTANAAEVELWRLDCGQIEFRVQGLFSDSFAYPDGKRVLTNSCYLIRHDSEYMLWDTGLPGAMAEQAANADPAAPFAPSFERTVASQLADLGVTPEQITRIGISHGHLDHTGQAADFAAATLLIGAGDLAAMQSDAPPFAFDPSTLAPWLTGSAPVEAVSGDRDIFGDGSVVMLAMPGHTAGETALLVRLAGAGPVLLSGDVVHFEEQMQRRAVPVFNADRADSLASMARLREVADNLGAQLVIQHEPEDTGLLAAFPDSTK